MKMANFSENIDFKKQYVTPIYYFYSLYEVTGFMPHAGRKDLYNIIATESPLVRQYDNFTLPRIESFLTYQALMVAGTSQAHVKGEELVTSICGAMLDPWFYR